MPGLLICAHNDGIQRGSAAASSNDVFNGGTPGMSRFRLPSKLPRWILPSTHEQLPKLELNPGASLHVVAIARVEFSRTFDEGARLMWKLHFNIQ